jgi:hypothetical protein
MIDGRYLCHVVFPDWRSAAQLRAKAVPAATEMEEGVTI